ncbi:MAG: DUF3275 family protein [Nevskia sp.]|nr:DUF3275 family protein [Nevskia sp.]
MITVSGTLAIRTIAGSRGNFNIGRLHTEIGEFAVKDSLIEEYEEGRYKGEFGISSIFPSTYFAGGRTVVEVRARLGSIALENITALHDADHAAPAEPDPIEASAPAAVQVEAPRSVVEPAAPAGESSETTSDTSADAEFRALFGELWPLGDTVKLDPTVDRQRFRLQVKAIGKSGLGYIFQPVGQVWVKP